MIINILIMLTLMLSLVAMVMIVMIIIAIVIVTVVIIRRTITQLNHMLQTLSAAAFQRWRDATMKQYSTK